MTTPLFIALRYFKSGILSLVILTFGQSLYAGPISKSPDNQWSKVSREELLKAVEEGNPEAQYYLAQMEFKRTDAIRTETAHYIHRVGGANAPSVEALKSKFGNTPEEQVRQAAAKGDREAIVFIGRLDIDRAIADERVAVEWLKKAADNNLISAQTDIAEYSLEGRRGFPINQTKALTLLRPAAEKGFERAQHLLSGMLIEGDGLPVSLEEGIAWLQKAADQNCWQAQLELAEQYACGNGEPRNDHDTPVALLTRAANQGLGRAQFKLARRYKTGLGVPKDYIEAIRWYRTARRGNDAAARDSYQVLAIVDEVGEIVPGATIEDWTFTEVLALYVKAVDRKSAEAQFHIAELFAAGHKLPSNAVKAFFWYNLAAEQGFGPAVQERKKLQRSVTEGDLQNLRAWSEQL